MANVANLMNGATVPRIGKLAIGAKASIISKLFVVPRLCRALTEARSHSRPDVVPRGATMARAKEVASQHQKKKTPKKPPKQNAYAVTMKNSVPSEVTTTSGGEREKQGNVLSKMVLSGPEEEGMYNSFLALQFTVKCLKAPMLRVSPQRGCILTQIQTIGLRSLQMDHQNAR